MMPQTRRRNWPSLRGLPAGCRGDGASEHLGPAGGHASTALVVGSRTVSWRELPSRAATSLTPEMVLAGLGGLALGLSSLLSLASLVYLVPAIIVAGVLLAARRAAGVAFSIGLCAGSGYGIAAGFLLAQPLTGPQAVPLPRGRA